MTCVLGVVSPGCRVDLAGWLLIMVVCADRRLSYAEFVAVMEAQVVGIEQLEAEIAARQERSQAWQAAAWASGVDAGVGGES